MNPEQDNSVAGNDQCISMGIYTDRQGRVEEANKGFASAFGWAPEALSGQNVSELLHGDVPTVVLAEILQSIRHNRVWTGVLRMVGKDGESAWLKTTVAPVAGQPGRFLWTFGAAGRSDVAAAERRFSRIASGREKLKKGFFGKLRQRLLDMPIGLKIGGFSALLTLVLATFLIVEGLSTVSGVLDEDEHSVQMSYSEIVDISIRNLGERAAALATLVANMPETIEAMRKHDRDRLLQMFAKPFAALRKEYGLKQFQFHLPPATSFLRLHRSEESGDDLSGFRKTVELANEEHKPVIGLEEGHDGFGVFGVVPIVDNGSYLGSVEFGSSFGPEFFERFKQKHHVEVAFFELTDGGARQIGSTLPQIPALDAAEVARAMSGEMVKKDIEVEGRPFGLMYRKLVDFSGRPVGVLAIGRDRSAYVATMSRVTRHKLLVALAVLVFAIFASWWVARSISRPIQQASTVARQISGGIYNNPIEVRSDDETGQLLRAMAAMQATLGYNLHEARESAEENARIKTALDYISTSVTVSDSAGKLIFMNNACLDLFRSLARTQPGNERFDPATLIGTRLMDFFDDEGLRAIYSRQLSDREVVEYGLWEHDFELVISPVYDSDGNYVARVTQWNDITAERQVGREIQAIVGSARGGDLTRSIDLEQKEGFYRELAEGINELIAVVSRVIDDIAAAMSRIAAGDLTAPIDKDYSGIFGEVKNSVNETIADLRKMVVGMTETSLQISSSASEIQSGNDELSQRTEQQASSLETTAASMEQITGTVKQNAENAQASTDLAARAQAVSTKGVGVVADAIKAMELISESSIRIEEIIQVIDEIAFQTNLLALNAAVEAARAGEQGRGFAVVATEVRDLAGRSSEAAKQIKQLISDSVERVERGTGLVNEAGETLDEIADSISQVTRIMSEIAHANQEQAVGIEQVNRSIAQIDQVTQQNTALAEQTAAVAISLKNQSVQLEQMIARFTVEEAATDATDKPFLHAV